MATKKSSKEQTLAEAFGTTVRSVRAKAGLTQDTLAFHVDVSPGYMSQIERGKTNITLSILWSLARTLKVKPSELIKGAEKSFKLEGSDQ